MNGLLAELFMHKLSFDYGDNGLIVSRYCIYAFVIYILYLCAPDCKHPCREHLGDSFFLEKFIFLLGSTLVQLFIVFLLIFFVSAEQNQFAYDLLTSFEMFCILIWQQSHIFANIKRNKGASTLFFF